MVSVMCELASISCVSAWRALGPLAHAFWFQSCIALLAQIVDVLDRNLLLLTRQEGGDFPVRHEFMNDLALLKLVHAT